MTPDGRVGFIARVSATGATREHDAVFLASDGGLTELTPASLDPAHEFRDDVQVTATGTVVAFDKWLTKVIDTWVPEANIRGWGPAAGSVIQVARTVARGALTDSPAVANAGTFVVYGQWYDQENITEIRLYDTQTMQTTARVWGPTSPNGRLHYRPMVSNNGRVVLRIGDGVADPIWLSTDSTLVTPQRIAAWDRGGFSYRIGAAPGINSDGSIVGFAGQKTATTPPGVYISVQLNLADNRAPRQIIRIVGDTEGRQPGQGDLGTAADGSPLFFADVDIDTRVSVVSLSNGAAGLEDDPVLMCFVGTPNAASPHQPVGAPCFSEARGIWVARGTLKRSPTNPAELTFQMDKILPLLQQGEIIAGIGQVTDVTVNDGLGVGFPPAGADRATFLSNHSVTFWTDSGSGQAIVLARPLLTIDTLDAENEAAHHTDLFVDELAEAMVRVPLQDHSAVKRRLILRRGNTSDIALRVPTTLFPQVHVLGFEAKDILANPPLVKNIPLVQGSLPSGSWAVRQEGAPREASGVTEVRYRFSIPVNAAIGEYELSVRFRVGAEPGCEAEQAFPETVAVLFNPWEGYNGSRDQVFWEDSTEELDEYVLKEEGWIWQVVTERRNGQETKRRKPLTWKFEQFNSPYCLESVLYSLDNLDPSERAHAPAVARYFTRRANSLSTAQPGVLVGNWTGNYTGGTDPESWVSSADILRLYATSRTPVPYGQCWVFGGILTSLLRAVGIPTRPVTNFDSAHSMDSEPGQVDFYYFLDIARRVHPTKAYQDRNGNWHKGYYDAGANFVDRADFELNYCTRDKIWEYHVWCDAWMERSGARGWQAVDGTPQGYDGTGPAAHSAILGNSGGDYDVDFLVEEVDAPVRFWIVKQNASGAWERQLASVPGRPNPDYAAVGTEIVTQQPSSRTAPLPETRLTITALYKPAPFHPLRGPEGILDWDVAFLAPAAVSVGQAVPYVIELTNRSSSTRVFHIDLALAIVGYNGEAFAALPSPLSAEVIVPSGGTEVLAPVLDASVYLPASLGADTIEAHLGVVETDTLEVVAVVRRTGLAEPAITLSVPRWPCHAGEAFAVSAAWTNDLAMPLTSGSLLVSTHGILTQPDLSTGVGQTRTNLGVQESLYCATNAAGLAEGGMLVAATVSSPDLAPIQETGIVYIGPQLRLSIKRTSQNGIALEFLALNGRRYTLETGDPSPGGSWITLGGELLGYGTNTVVVLPSQDHAGFYRVRALPQ